MIRAGVGGPRLVQAVTVIVPVIEGWTLQWNGNVPASVNVNSNVLATVDGSGVERSVVSGERVRGARRRYES